MRCDAERLVRICRRGIESAVIKSVEARRETERQEHAVRQLAEELCSKYADVDDYGIFSMRQRYRARIDEIRIEGREDFMGVCPLCLITLFVIVLPGILEEGMIWGDVPILVTIASPFVCRLFQLCELDRATLYAAALDRVPSIRGSGWRWVS